MLSALDAAAAADTGGATPAGAVLREWAAGGCLERKRRIENHRITL